MDISGVHIWDYHDLDAEIASVLQRYQNDKIPGNYAPTFHLKEALTSESDLIQTIMKHGAVITIQENDLQHCIRFMWDLEREIPPKYRTVFRVTLKDDDYDKKGIVYIQIKPQTEIHKTPVTIGILTELGKETRLSFISMQSIKKDYPFSHNLLSFRD